MMGWKRDEGEKNPFDSSTNGSYSERRRGPISNNGDSVKTPPTAPPSLFPPWLSSWMISSPSKRQASKDYDDDSDSFHDCISNIDVIEDYSISSYEEETTSLLRKPPLYLNSNHSNSQLNNLYDSISTDTPPRNNSNQTQNGDNSPLLHHDHSTPVVLLSPLDRALSWISPFKYGKNKETDNSQMITTPQHSGINNIKQTPKSAVTHTQNSRKRKAQMTPLQRAMSSPSLMTMSTLKFDNENDEEQRKSSKIILKEIDNDLDDHSDDVLHPWTKLILLEELGTARSWLVLLLPYAFMILAVILDGDSQLKNTTVGPLSGSNACANVMNEIVPSAFDISAKGYFPVPFQFGSAKFADSCSYPYELREGVGLLAHGMSPEFNSTTLSSASSSAPSGRSSIVDGRYRHLMSHGFAFTSGVISDVPATSESLSGVAKFNDISNEAVKMVASGQVLVSAIVFQRQKVLDEKITQSENSPERANAQMSRDVQEWSPVLILNPKQLDMFCTLRQKGHKNTTSIDQLKSIRWNCTNRHIVDAFFALPNTAVLTGEDLRVDILLSYRKPRASISMMNQEFTTRDILDDYFASYDSIEDATLSDAQKLLSRADVSYVYSNHKDLLAEIAEKSVYNLEHESGVYENVVESTRIFALVVTVVFLCYWCLSMIAVCEDGTNHKDAMNAMQRLKRKICHIWNQANTSFWWESPWVTFPERRYLQFLVVCLILLQNPLLLYAHFHPSLYSSTRFRCAADSLSGISIQGTLFLWLALVHGLRYHTAELNRRRFDQYRRVSQLRQATKHIKPPNDVGNDRWAQVRWYYNEYGDFHGGGAAISMALRHKHDTYSDSFFEFIFPKVTLLIVGVISTVTAAIYRFPVSEMEVMTPTTAAYLNPDHFSHGSKVYVISSVVQFVVIEIWCVFIVYTSFVTAERLRREPFLSTRPAQLSFRVLSGILFLGVGFSFTLFYMSTMKMLHNTDDSVISQDEIVYDSSRTGMNESWDSRADFLFRILRVATSQSPYVGTASNIGPGKMLYATACSLVAAFIFLPSSNFRASNREIQSREGNTEISGTSKQTMLAIKDRRIQGRDKRFVVALARNSHTWRVFPLPIRSHSILSQHTLKEQLNFVGTFQLDGQFNTHKFKFGRGTIYKGKYMPVFCIELACWLLEASWQTYYSPTEYSHDDWAPGRMNIEPMGLRVDHFIDDDESDTHAFVATNVSEQVEGEEDSIIVVAFRGTASMSNIATDLTFSQVPLHDKVMSDSPAFSIRPGEDIAVDESAWDMDEATPIEIVQGILLNRSASYEPSGDQESTLLPSAVSHGAKAVIRATPMARQALPCVHEGFQLSYMKVRRQIIEAILSVMKRQIDKAIERSKKSGSEDEPLTLPKIYLTGHSLGGCLSQLLALDLASNCEIVIEQPSGANEILLRHSFSSMDLDEEMPSANGDFVDACQHQNELPKKVIRLRPPIAVYTFGQPRLGNVAFKTLYKQRVPHTYRVATEGDAITTMPTLGPLCSGIYRHAGLEVLLEEGCTGNILVGPTVIETLLRFTKVRTSVIAHSLERYRESLESALGSEELREYYRGHGGKVMHSNQVSYSGSNGSTLPSWVTQVKRSRRI